MQRSPDKDGVIFVRYSIITLCISWVKNDITMAIAFIVVLTLMTHSAFYNSLQTYLLFSSYLIKI